MRLEALDGIHQDSRGVRGHDGLRGSWKQIRDNARVCTRMTLMITKWFWKIIEGFLWERDQVSRRTTRANA